jgi:hypothetical protein
MVLVSVTREEALMKSQNVQLLGILRDVPVMSKIPVWIPGIWQNIAFCFAIEWRVEMELPVHYMIKKTNVHPLHILQSAKMLDYVSCWKIGNI